MSETKTLFALGMLLIIVNVVMLGLSDYVVSNNLGDISCENLLPSNQSVLTIEEFQDSSITDCEGTEDYYIFGIWGLVNVVIIGALIYAFVPFVK